MTTLTTPPPLLDRLPGHLTTPEADPDLLRSELLALIADTIEAHPRSQQVALGPSEVGHPCARRIGYQLLGHPERPGDPNWKATVGTAVHAWLEEMLTADNPRQPARAEGFTRWVIEATVDCGEIAGTPLRGHCDLFDRVTGTVVDWKTVGPTQLKKYRTSGPGEQYRIQAHLYGRGWARRGQDVRTVAVMFLPRQGELRDAYYWHEPYDEQVALDAIARAEGIALTTQALGSSAPAALPTADAYCSLCPFYKAGSTDPAVGCPGDPAATRGTTAPFSDLLAG